MYDNLLISILSSHILTLNFVVVISTCKIKYRSYDTFNLKHENLSVFKAADNRAEAEYLWREVDEGAIQKLEKRMKVISLN